MTRLTLIELSHVSGGGAAWDAYVQRKVAARQGDWRTVICAGAAAKGGDDMAHQTYKERATDADGIRGGDMLEGLCLAGKTLPVGTPAFPFGAHKK